MKKISLEHYGPWLRPVPTFIAIRETDDDPNFVHGWDSEGALWQGHISNERFPKITWFLVSGNVYFFTSVQTDLRKD